ncbi:HNH endonuclease family protein [Corynebacterium sp. A21]|uniref:HNH endonuclease family protein n=1 Tax=Corynebacterium sp. A21 TaxID=3457318 RepID=UPI003FD084B2
MCRNSLKIRLRTTVLILGIGALGLGGCSVLDGAASTTATLAESTAASSAASTSAGPGSTIAAPGTASTSIIAADQNPEEIFRALLGTLQIKGRAPMTGYDRELFGQAWADDVDVTGGRNGCDTRNDILQRDLAEVQIRPGTEGCLVESGVLQDPFSGELMNFQRGTDTSGRVQIDHVVPLADAWAKGAQQLDEKTRRDFANDPLNLLAVNGQLNMEKGAGDAATWLPPDRTFRCKYAQRQIGVKATYGLWVTQAEYEALGRQLDTCG